MIRRPFSAYLTRVLLFCFLMMAGVWPLSPGAAEQNADAAAVIIGNKTYKSERIPAVDYAHRDAGAIKTYLIDVLGYRDGNIITLHDATQAEMEGVFGNSRTHEGRLWEIVRTERSDITVFFSGHGVPGLKDKKGYLLPVDSHPERPEINGFSIDTLYENLTKLGGRSTTVYLEACFSGDSAGGALINNASGIAIEAKIPLASKGMVVLTASQGDQVSSWDNKNKHGLFTHHLLEALYGKADTDKYGNGNGEVTLGEIKTYLDEEMTYAARREYGRHQNATVQGDRAFVMAHLPDAKPIPRPKEETSSPLVTAAREEKENLSKRQPQQVARRTESGTTYFLQPTMYNGNKYRSATDAIHRSLQGLPNSHVVREGKAAATDTTIAISVVLLGPRQVKNPEHAGAAMLDSILGDLASALTEDIKEFVVVYDAEVLLIAKNLETGSSITETGKAVVKLDDYGNENAASEQALNQAFMDGSKRLVTRLAGGVPTPWQPPVLFPKKVSTGDTNRVYGR